MTKEEKTHIKEIIDHFVDMYKLDLAPHFKAYQVWFENNLTSEIVIDFLRKVKIPANVRVRKVSNLPILEDGIRVRGRIHLLEKGQPLLFYTREFKATRFLIEIHKDCYNDFSIFITTLIHELSHLVLYSTYNKYYKSEVATDLFVMCFGLFSFVKSSQAPGYITKEEVDFARKYIHLKQKYLKSRGIKKLILRVWMQVL